jgi:hypothetical protein
MLLLLIAIAGFILFLLWALYWLSPVLLLLLLAAAAVSIVVAILVGAIWLLAYLTAALPSLDRIGFALGRAVRRPLRRRAA